ncbi:MAG TPA: HAD family hydrolase [Sphaerochaeta sp.]|jgi:phosphoglycolate phosphatase|nr:HAD family hydrolase [Sphaerochaeta sp.]HBO36191.1 HAD family hydrolase [Sphaerochaeta sp.]
MQKPVVKAILFDLDGTLVDTIEDIRRSLAHALAGEGLPPPSANLTRQVVGRGLHNALKGALSWFDRTVGEDRFNQLYQEMLLYYREHYAVYSHPYEGVEQLLQHLLESGYTLGVYSNKEDGLTKRIAASLFPGIRFSWVRGMLEGFPGKPDRSGIDYFCRKTGLVVQNVLYIGDSEVDWQTALNAGCPHILVSWGFRPKEELLALQGAVVVDTIHELEDAIYGIQREGFEK